MIKANNSLGNPDLVLEASRKNDKQNLARIQKAFDSGLVDAPVRDHLVKMYSDGMQHCGDTFYALGRVLGAPKTAVFSYDVITGKAGETKIKIKNINPQGSYLVHHRFNNDPMRNQFFDSDGGHNINLSVSSIITVIVAAQKSVSRAIEKITGKYRKFYTEDVIRVSTEVLSRHINDTETEVILDKIQKKFSEKFISNAAEAVISIIGSGFENLSVELVRELDKIRTPAKRLNDIYRMKCLFDLIPQARAFIADVKESFQDKIISIRDNFFDLDNPRNYRDSKIILNIGTDERPVPLEIICQVRTFFDFERNSHKSYESIRSNGKNSTKSDQNANTTNIHQEGIRHYNAKICDFLGDLFERVGWNILYRKADVKDGSLFEGFPRIASIHYPQKVAEAIFQKIENNVKNEVFKLEDTPVELDIVDEAAVFKYLTSFVLTTAIPYSSNFIKIEGDGIQYRLFNFIMAELYRYHKNQAPIMDS